MERLCHLPKGRPAQTSDRITPFTLTLPRVYNVPMPSPSQDRSSSVRHPRHHVYALETTGLLIIAAILLTITLVRSWYAIHWSLR